MTDEAALAPPVPPPAPVPSACAPAATVVGPSDAVPAAPPVGVAQADVAGSVATQSVESATSDVPGQAALPTAPALPTAATPVLPPPTLAGPAPALPEAAPPAQRQPSPGRRQQRPHSPAPRDEPETSKRRHDSPRRRGSQANCAAPRGGHGGWWGQPHRGGGWAYDQPVTMADLQRAVSAAVREERNGQASQSNSPVSLRPLQLLLQLRPPCRQLLVPVRLFLLPLLQLHRPPPQIVTFGCHPRPASVGAAHPFQALVGPQHTAEVYGHAALSQGDSLMGGPRDECLDAADRLAELLAPVLAAPARGGLAKFGQLGSAVRGLRQFLHAGTRSGAIATATVLVRELHRSMSGLLVVFYADRM
ncbi:unnamed protein product [Closterium sp. Naga37s-1]|nr:unnamed protein product [Closterium sp. Naga37s-1]